MKTPANTTYLDKTTTGPSPELWADCPVLDMIQDPGVGYYFFDDFVGGVLTPTITTAIQTGNGWNGFADANGTITYASASAGGEIILSHTTDGKCVAINHEPHPFVISNVSGKFWFEARIKMSIVTPASSGESSLFLGLSDATPTATAILTDSAGAIADQNCVGFHKLDTDAATIDCSYKANGIAAAKVNDATIVPVLATYLQLGMKVEPAGGNQVLSFWKDGVPEASTKTIINALGTTFPSDVGMGLIAAMAIGTDASTQTLTIDWIRAAQLRV